MIRFHRSEKVERFYEAKIDLFIINVEYVK